jgi:hypothetical protein
MPDDGERSRLPERRGIEHVLDVHAITLFDPDQYEQSLRRAGIIGIETLPSPMSGRDRYIGVTPSH